MSLGEHELFLDSLANVESCLPSKHARYKRHDSLEKLLLKQSLLPIERYKIDSFYWCDTCRYFFIRLDGIREMTTRSIYLRKGEEKDMVIIKWLSHNYHFYILIYQSALDIALLLVNSVLDLGIPYRNCNWAAIYENRKVRDSSLHPVLKSLEK